MPAGRFVWRTLTENASGPGAELTLPDEIARQARDVLRLRSSDVIFLLDGVGGEYEAVITRVSRRDVVVEIGPRREGLANPTPPLTLCLGMLKAARLELVLQKGTELGVAAFQPLITERSVAVADELSETKRRRYERILAEALEQCGGAWLPEMREPLTLSGALAAAPPGTILLIPWEAAKGQPLRVALQRESEARPIDGIWLFIGPEGGFSAAEVALAERHGARAVTLGRRILRAETAALVAVTLALDALGALDVGPAGAG
jgi:16S rRNA (uracil1498-N3)-methyltransferase